MDVKTVKPRKKWWRFWRHDKPIEPELWIAELKIDGGKWVNTIYYGNSSAKGVYMTGQNEAKITGLDLYSIFLIIGRGDLIINKVRRIKGCADGLTVYGKVNGNSGYFIEIGKRLGDRILDLKGNESLYLLH